jgi:N-methylhydantoinase B
VCSAITGSWATITVSLSSARQTRPARGFSGGQDGLCGAFLLNPETPDQQILPGAAVDLPLRRGDVLRVLTPSGGGFGSVIQ